MSTGRGIAIGIGISAAIVGTIFLVWKLSHSPTQQGTYAGSQRRLGVPRIDIERAISHYGITESEYLAHPERYPLPGRGTRVTAGY